MYLNILMLYYSKVTYILQDIAKNKTNTYIYLYKTFMCAN